MRFVIICSIVLFAAVPLAAQDSGRSNVDSTTSSTVRSVRDSLHVVTFAKESRSWNGSTRLKMPGETSTSSALPYVLGGAIIGTIAVGVGLAISMSRSKNEFIGSPIVFAPLFVGSAGLGAGIGYLVYRARQ